MFVKIDTSKHVYRNKYLLPKVIPNSLKKGAMWDLHTRKTVCSHNKTAGRSTGFSGLSSGFYHYGAAAWPLPKSKFKSRLPTFQKSIPYLHSKLLKYNFLKAELYYMKVEQHPKASYLRAS